MKVLRWSAAAALAAMVCAAPSFANDDLSAMKASLDNMKIEMEAMRSQLNAEREALRSNAGGAPEGLTSAKGNATIRIGGDVRIQYGIGWANGFARQHYVAWDEGGVADGDSTSVKSTIAGWDVARAELDFDIDLSCDTKGFIALRFDERGSYGNTGILDKAYWQWSNIGGSGFGLSVGLMDIPFGMWANTDMGGYDFDGVDRPLITDPFVRNALAPIDIYGLGAIAPLFDRDLINQTNLGIIGSYSFDDQLVIKAGLMASSWELDNPGFDSRLTYANANRNIGFIDHFITLGWNPCWLEGLHVEFGYMGRFDDGRGVDLFVFEGNPYAFDYTQANSGDHAYKPAFDLGVNYKINDQWRVYAEGVLAWNPGWGDGFNFALTTGVDYRLTEKLMLGAGFEFFHANYAAEYYNNGFDAVNNNINDRRPLWGNGALNENLYRLTLGAKYDFGNGLYLQAQYYHDMYYAAGVGDQGLKDADAILLQTGFQF